MTQTAIYTQPSAMEPLLPQADQVELAELTSELLRKSGRLSGLVPSKVTRERIARLVRGMNS